MRVDEQVPCFLAFEDAYPAYIVLEISCNFRLRDRRASFHPHRRRSLAIDNLHRSGTRPRRGQASMPGWIVMIYFLESSSSISRFYRLVESIMIHRAIYAGNLNAWIAIVDDGKEHFRTTKTRVFVLFGYTSCFPRGISLDPLSADRW